MYQFFLTPFEYNELKTKYIEEYGSDDKIPTLKELQDIYEDVHQSAFRRMLPAMASEEHITFKKICDKIKEFEWQALKKDYPKYVCLGIENDIRIDGVARQVERFLRDTGYVIEEEESTKVEELVCPKMPEIKVREVNAKEDPVLDLAKAFYKALGQFIETRTA